MSAPELSHRVEDPPGTVRVDGELTTEDEARRYLEAHQAAERDVVALAQDYVGRAARFQAEADAKGYGRPPRPPVEWHATGMRASTVVEVAVVRAARPSRCERCRHRRVVYALTVVTAAIGNPDAPWRCAPCWGLR